MSKVSVNLSIEPTVYPPPNHNLSQSSMALSLLRFALTPPCSNPNLHVEAVYGQVVRAALEFRK